MERNSKVLTPEEVALDRLHKLHGILEDLTQPGSEGYEVASDWVKEELLATDEEGFSLLQSAMTTMREEIADAAYHWADMQVIMDREAARRAALQES